jgi:hypothetical protein
MGHVSCWHEGFQTGRVEAGSSQEKMAIHPLLELEGEETWLENQGIRVQVLGLWPYTVDVEVCRCLAILE